MAPGGVHLDAAIDSTLLGHTKGSDGSSKLVRQSREALVKDQSDRVVTIALFQLFADLDSALGSANLPVR